jgi:hypothetical protein
MMLNFGILLEWMLRLRHFDPFSLVNGMYSLDIFIFVLTSSYLEIVLLLLELPIMICTKMYACVTLYCLHYSNANKMNLKFLSFNFINLCFRGMMCLIFFSFCFISFRVKILLCRSVWPRTCYAAQTGLELAILLPLPLNCWDYRCAPPRLAISLFLKKWFYLETVPLFILKYPYK